MRIRKIFYIAFVLFLFILALVLSYSAVFYLLKYDILTKHDLVFAYGREFLKQEHGRYFANYFVNLTTAVSELTNIHPNDLQPNITAHIKGTCVILQCLLITNIAFLFKKSRCKFLSFSFNF